MQVKSYSPSVEAYAMTGRDRETIDLSDDIVSCNVNRRVDGMSDFSMVLQNKNWKYNGVFMPFDPIVIYCTKDERVKLFTGYVCEFDAYKLYQSDFKLKGYCTIYRLQNMYWDPYLVESQELMFADAYANGMHDNGFAMVAERLLVNVGFWPSDAILFGDMPAEAVEYAYDMYQANLDSANQLTTMIDEFYEVLRTRGPKVTSGTSSTDVTSGAFDPTGQTIEIPLEDGGVQLGTYGTFELNPATYGHLGGTAGAIQDAWFAHGSQYNAAGAAVIDGKMLIACTSTFGIDGDWITWVFTDGTSIETIVADEKSQEYAPWDHNPANKWGHDNGACILEFQGDYSRLGDAPYGPLGLNGKRLQKAINHGNYVPV